MSVASSITEGGYIGFTLDNVGIDRRIYTGLTSTNPTLNVSYNAGRVDVYLNGVKLVGNHPEMGGSTHDYTYTGTGQGSNIVLATGVALVAADVVECIGYVSNSSNTVTTYNPTPASGGGWNVFSGINNVASDLVNVYLNGVLLDDSDYTLDASANTLTIGGATLTASDVVMVQVIGALDNADMVPASTGGTFAGNVAFTGNIQVDDIVEKTSAHGVEIEGVLLKDSTITGGTIEGTSVISTGESGSSKFLREDGDGTCSWQAVAGFPSGTKMLFHQTSAPTGWTKVTTTGTGSDSIDDVGLRIVTGTITAGSGGSVAFDTAFASQTIATHTLATSEIPGHTHTYSARMASGWNSVGGYQATAVIGSFNTGSTGGGGSHGHGSIDLNVKYIDLIVASKD